MFRVSVVCKALRSMQFSQRYNWHIEVTCRSWGHIQVTCKSWGPKGDQQLFMQESGQDGKKKTMNLPFRSALLVYRKQHYIYVVTGCIET